LQEPEPEPSQKPPAGSTCDPTATLPPANEAPQWWGLPSMLPPRLHRLPAFQGWACGEAPAGLRGHLQVPVGVAQ
ncbi:hypothetical protein HispidOSU_015348, partial [Sigmodon hispidus]